MVDAVTRATMLARLRSLALTVWHFVSGAPLTYTWLVVLTITTAIQNQLAGHKLHTVLLHRSTNIYELGTDPLEVLFSSLLWIDGKNLEPYLLLFTLFLAPAEHWLGHLRWLTVGLTAHIGATYFSEGLLYFAIQHRDASERLVHSRDMGVSYFLVGVMAVLTFHIVKPWRWGYLAALLVIFGFPLITMDKTELDFSAVGHFTSILFGLAFYPMARDLEGAQVNPAKLKTAFRRRRAPRTST
ncbi:rhomboid-like protein [Mycobacterium sp.]|uniref:rhomboid-like protein n=1 Tax=Mycobacterium sp. TaxID=1785 RepID=UPI003BAB473C